MWTIYVFYIHYVTYLILYLCRSFSIFGVIFDCVLQKQSPTARSKQFIRKSIKLTLHFKQKIPSLVILSSYLTFLRCIRKRIAKVQCFQCWEYSYVFPLCLFWYNLIQNPCTLNSSCSSNSRCTSMNSEWNNLVTSEQVIGCYLFIMLSLSWFLVYILWVEIFKKIKYYCPT